VISLQFEAVPLTLQAFFALACYFTELFISSLAIKGFYATDVILDCALTGFWRILEDRNLNRWGKQST